MTENKKIINKLLPGFTLIELLVVISIIALLLSILLPALTRAKEMAKELVCSSNMKSLGQASMIYANDYNDNIPLAGSRDSNGYLVSGYPTSPYWDVRLLSYLGAPNFNLDSLPAGVIAPDSDNEELKSHSKLLKFYLCPSVRSSQRGIVSDIEERYKYPRSYAINFNISGLKSDSNGQRDMTMSYRRSTSYSNITRSSGTLLFIDRRIHSGSGVNVLYGAGVRGWYDIYPAHNVTEESGDNQWNPWRFPTAHGRSNFCFADGHVENLKCQFTTYETDVTSTDNPDRISGVKLSARYGW